MGATLSASTTWDDAAKVMEGKPFAQALDEAERKSAFAELAASLGDDEEGALPDSGKDQGGGAERAPEAGEEADGKEGDKKRKKEKRHRSHREDEDEEERERRHKRKKEKRERRERGEGEEGHGAD